VKWLVLSLVICLALLLLAVLALIAVGRRRDARALVRFIPDCAILVRRLLVDPTVPLRRKVLLVGLLG
jgi:hypothetical protein